MTVRQTLTAQLYLAHSSRRMALNLMSSEDTVTVLYLGQKLSKALADKGLIVIEP